MRKLRQVMVWIAAWMLLWKPLTAEAAGQPDVFGQYAVSIDARTGDVLYDKQANHQAFPASITKVLTAILLIEHMKPEDRITFSQAALAEEKSNYQAEFVAGETMDRNTALMTLMVLSANDVAYAIAEKISGNTEAFAQLMNEKAAALGAKNSHFVRPSGLHDPNHYTTPYDMAMITRGALQYPEIMKAMITKRTSITTSRQTLSIFNKGRFFENPDCIGGKTGFTSQARNTLVEINQKGDAKIINVVMASQKPDIYNDMNLISNHAFPQLAKHKVLDQATWMDSLSFLDKEVQGVLERSADVVLKKGEEKNVQSVMQPLKFDEQKLYTEGIETGEVLGQVNVIKNGLVLDSVNVIAKESMSFERPEPKQAAISPFPVLGLVIAVVAGGIGIFVSTMRRRGKAA